MQCVVCTRMKTPTLLTGSICLSQLWCCMFCRQHQLHCADTVHPIMIFSAKLCKICCNKGSIHTPQRCFFKSLHFVCKCQFCTGSCGRANDRKQQHRAFCAAAVVCADRCICGMWLEEEQGVHRRCLMSSYTQSPSLRGAGLSGSYSGPSALSGTLPCCTTGRQASGHHADC